MKKLNQRGFTLAELLIVVAIIAVMVAVSIPVFTSQLEKSREETDMANLRSAYALVQTAALTEDYKQSSSDTDFQQKGKWTKSGNGYYAFYDIKKGEITDTASASCQGKGTTTEGGAENYTGPIYYTQGVNAKTRYLGVYILDNAGGGYIDSGVGFTTKSAAPFASSDFT